MSHLNKSRHLRRFLLSGLTASAFMLAGTASASMGNLGTTFGAMPSDVATAQAMSLFSTNASAIYYNPAYITHDPRGELTIGVMQAKPELEVNSVWQSSPAVVNRSGTNILESTPSQQVLIGMKTDLSDLTDFKKSAYLGVVIGVGRWSREMLAFNSSTSQAGQYFEYGRKPLFLAIGGGSTLWRGISAGFSTRITLHSSATLNATATLGGKTSYEQMTVSAEPQLRPIFGLNIDWGDTFCPDSDCWLDGFETAFAYRRYSNSQTAVTSNITIPGTLPSPGVALSVLTLDSYQPNIYTAGIKYGHKKDFRVALTWEFQEWSKLNSELESDTIKDQAVAPGVAHLEFQDVVVPRLGGEVWMTDNIMLMGGVAFVESPLKSNKSLDVNYLSADRLEIGLGARFLFPDPWIFTYPLRIDIGYQYQKIDERKFELYTSNAVGASVANPKHYETVKTGGAVNVISAALTLKF